MTDSVQIKHIEEEALERYALGKLTEDQVAPLEEHLFVCHECQDRLEAADDLISKLRVAAPLLDAQPAPEPWYERFFRIPKLAWVPAMAAAAVVAIVIQTTPSLDRSQVVELRALRGGDSTSEAESGSLLTLKLGTEGLTEGQPYRVEIVNSRGTRIWYGVVAWADGVARVNVPKLLGAGQYWVRLYGVNPESQLVREYGLKVR
jgi:hypothetical protein